MLAGLLLFRSLTPVLGFPTVHLLRFYHLGSGGLVCGLGRTSYGMKLPCARESGGLLRSVAVACRFVTR